MAVRIALAAFVVAAWGIALRSAQLGWKADQALSECKESGGQLTVKRGGTFECLNSKGVFDYE